MFPLDRGDAKATPCMGKSEQLARVCWLDARCAEEGVVWNLGSAGAGVVHMAAGACRAAKAN